MSRSMISFAGRAHLPLSTLVAQRAWSSMAGVCAPTVEKQPMKAKLLCGTLTGNTILNSWYRSGSSERTKKCQGHCKHHHELVYMDILYFIWVKIKDFYRHFFCKLMVPRFHHSLLVEDNQVPGFNYQLVNRWQQVIIFREKKSSCYANLNFSSNIFCPYCIYKVQYCSCLKQLI